MILTKCKCSINEHRHKANEWRNMFYSLTQLRALRYTGRQCKELLVDAQRFDSVTRTLPLAL